MSIHNSLYSLAALIFGLVFPEKCAVCGETGAFICVDCLAVIDSESKISCGSCRLPPEKCRCHMPAYTDAVVFPCFYRGNAFKSVIFAFKERNNKKINDYFAEKLYSTLRKNDKIDMDKIDIITNVPRRRRSVNKYGYDQTKVLAKLLSAKTGIRYLPLLSAGGYAEQKKLSAAERTANVRNKFKIIDRAACTGGNILILDDVLTTGSTISECARMLKFAGAKSVSAICAAAVRKS